MKIKGFHIGEGCAPINHFLSKGTRIHCVRLTDGYCFIEYEEVESQSTITKVLIGKGGISKQPPGGVNNVFGIDGASNFHWDVQIDREQRVTTFVVFWDEPKPDLQASPA